MIFLPRDYQLQCTGNCLMSWLKHESILIVLPTGMGKTEIFVSIADRWELGRVLVIAPTIQLVGQAADKIYERTGVAPGIEQASSRSNESWAFRSPFVVACGPTLKSRQGGGYRWERLRDIGLVIFDEAHLAVTPQYKQMLEWYRQHGAKVLGVTASPIRSDGKAMGNLFDDCPFQMSIAEAVGQGWLVPAKTHCVQLETLDLSEIGKGRGDFSEKELRKVMEAEKVVFEIAEVTARESGTLKTAVFCATVAEARAVGQLLSDRYHLKADWICGDKKLCSDDRRKRVLESFTRDPEGIQIVCNVGVLTTGWDFPGLEHIVMARPTKSIALYTQIFGRGTRPLKGVVDFIDSDVATRQAAIAASRKPHFKVTDMCDNSMKHKLISAADVLGGEMGLEVVERAKKALQAAGEAVSLDEALREAKKQVDKEQEEKERKRRAKVAARAKYKTVQVDPFDPYQRGDIHKPTPTNKKMKFGKYKGMDLADVPTDYLRWAFQNLAWFKWTAHHELKRRQAVAS